MSVKELLQVDNPRQPVSIDPGTPVVVYDQCTECFDSLPTDHFVSILLRKLSHHYREVSLLKGGIVEFQTHFGSLCERRNMLPLDLAPQAAAPTSPDSDRGVDAVDGYAGANQRSPPFLTAMSVPLCNIGPTRILDHLYLGSQADAMDADVLRANGVTHILNVSNNPKTPHVSDTYFFRIDVNDGYVDKILPHFQKGFMFLEKVRQAGGRALVHCLAGISRSPTLAIAYLMQFMHMSSDDAYRYVKERRANIAPNFNFLGQLLEFERQLRSKRRDDSAASTPLCDLSPLPMAVASASASPLPLCSRTLPATCSPVPTPSAASEGSHKKKRPCLNRPSHLPAEKKSAKTSSFGSGPSPGPSFDSASPPAATKPPVSPMYECLLGTARKAPLDSVPPASGSVRPRTILPPSSLTFQSLRSSGRFAGARQNRLELPRSATVGQIASPTTALARLSFDNMSQFSGFPTTSLEKLSFMPCHSAVDRPALCGPPATAAALPRSKSALENLGTPAARPPWLNLSLAGAAAPPTSGPAPSAANPAASGRLRSPLTPRKQLGVVPPAAVGLRGAASPPGEPEQSAGRKSRSLEDMLEGLVPAAPGSCLAPEGAGGRRASGRTAGGGEAPCRLLDHSLHHSSSSLSSSAASGSQHSSMHSSMEILQVS